MIAIAYGLAVLALALAFPELASYLVWPAVGLLAASLVASWRTRVEAKQNEKTSSRYILVATVLACVCFLLNLGLLLYIFTDVFACLWEAIKAVLLPLLKTIVS